MVPSAGNSTIGNINLHDKMQITSSEFMTLSELAQSFLLQLDIPPQLSKTMFNQCCPFPLLQRKCWHLSPCRVRKWAAGMSHFLSHCVTPTMRQTLKQLLNWCCTHVGELRQSDRSVCELLTSVLTPVGAWRTSGS